MGIKQKIDAKIEKAKAENDCVSEKLQAEIDSTGMNKELKRVQSEAKKSIKVAKDDIKEIIN